MKKDMKDEGVLFSKKDSIEIVLVSSAEDTFKAKDIIKKKKVQGENNVPKRTTNYLGKFSFDSNHCTWI